MSISEQPREGLRAASGPAVATGDVLGSQVVSEPSPAIGYRRLSPHLRPWLGATAVTLVVAVVLLRYGPPGVDRAAHVYQTQLFAEHGWRLWDNYWYAGRYELVNYSVLYYPIAALVGESLAVGVAVVGASTAFAVLATGLDRRRGWIAALAFAVVWPTVLIAGQYPFALGTLFALSGLVALQRRRPIVALAAWLLAGLASPLVLLFLCVVLAGAAAGCPQSLRRPGVRVAVGGLALLVLVEVVVLRLFPSGGSFPFPWPDLLGIALLAGAGAAMAARQPRQPMLIGVFAAYAVAGLGAYIVPTGVGGNAARLLDYFAVPLLLLALAPHRFRPRAFAIGALLVAVLWQAIPVTRDLRGGIEGRAESAAFWSGTVAFLTDPSRFDADYRVEVVATWGHWESYHLAANGIPITRGWFRQDDFPVNQPLYTGTLDAASYQAWLRSMGVRYVVLPNEQLDYSAHAEARILRASDHGGLRRVFGGAQGPVQIFELPDPTPLLTPLAAAAPLVPGQKASVLWLDGGAISIYLPAAGVYDLRVRYTPYWASSDPSLCVSAAGVGGFTRLHAHAAGQFVLRFDLTLARSTRQALGEASPGCAFPPIGLER